MNLNCEKVMAQITFVIRFDTPKARARCLRIAAKDTHCRVTEFSADGISGVDVAKRSIKFK